MNAQMELEKVTHVYPGRTSMIRTARGVMTLQTEISGARPEVVTIVDYRGRVLHRFDGALPEGLGDEAAITRFANEFHGRIEARVRDSLAAVTRRAKPSEPSARGRVIARLFLAAARAYAHQDRGSAQALLRACRQLAPDDRRVDAALQRVC